MNRHKHHHQSHHKLAHKHRHQHKQRSGHKLRRHSDEVANGDPTDDREIEDVRDVNDDIVDDVGFRSGVSWPKNRSLL